MKKPSSHLNEVEDAILALPRVEKPEPWKGKNYVGAGESALIYLDIRAPVVQERLRKGFSFGGQKPRTPEERDTQWKIWDGIWKSSKYFEVMNGAIEFAAHQPIEDLVERAPLLIQWAKRSDNWAHSDGLSSIYASILEADPKRFLPQIETWSRSKNPWDRRQSLVGLLCYARGRKKHPALKTLLKYIERQMDDPHYYVQKGVGWTVRETYQVYPREMIRWIEANVARIHPAAWQASTEKLSPAVKAKLKKLRRSSQR